MLGKISLRIAAVVSDINHNNGCSVDLFLNLIRLKLSIVWSMWLFLINLSNMYLGYTIYYGKRIVLRFQDYIEKTT